MNSLQERLQNEAGIVTGMMLLMLAIFTVLGVSAIMVSMTEMSLASNDQFSKIAFYGAEAARGYVPRNRGLYGVDNITVNGGISFPDMTDDAIREPFGANQEFNGEVLYNGSGTPPRGSGFEIGTFKAHNYRMMCNGYGPRGTESQIEAGFYRIGF